MSEAPSTPPAVADAPPHPLVTALKLFASAYRIELILFVVTFVVLSLSKILLSRLKKGEGSRT